MTILWYINNVERHASCILVGKPIAQFMCEYLDPRFVFTDF